MDSDWTEAYRSSEEWSELWEKVHCAETEWPASVQSRGSRVYSDGKLCIPESLVADAFASLHENAGHLGAERLVAEAKRRYLLPKSVNQLQMATRVKRLCLTCQECEPPNWSLSQPIRMSPVPETIFSHICVDIFSMPTESFAGESFDCMVVWVDRLSGWILARPSQKRGLTAEKTASIMMDAGWDIFGVPNSITSDQGPQFAGKFFRTVCSRLGIRQAFSHAYRPQGNGRAEMAGKQLMTLLRKLNAESGINWVEALPRALFIHHGIPGETGLSPHQIVFGRDRSVTGVPYPTDPECEDARDFIERIQELDKKISQTLTERHRKTQESLNRKRKSRPAFSVGDQVWYLRPKGVGGNKISTWWTGPFRIHARTGASSYELEIQPGKFHECHADQLKPGPPLPETSEGVPLFFNRSLRGPSPRVEFVRQHDSAPAGDRRFLVHWAESHNREDSWVSQGELDPADLPVVSAYCATAGLPTPENQGQATIHESAEVLWPDRSPGPAESAASSSHGWSDATRPAQEHLAGTDERECIGCRAGGAGPVPSECDTVGEEPVGDASEAQ
jgi:transposase InsO family protein